MKPTEAITLSESKELIACEAVLDRAKQTFSEVARALVTIRDKRLYRGEYKTFAEYCAKRHGWARRYSYNMAKAGEVIKSLPECAIVHNEGQARALSSVDPANRTEVIRAASAKADEESRPMTAADVREAAETIEDDESQQDAEAIRQPDPTPKPPQPPHDPDKNLILEVDVRFEEMTTLALGSSLKVMRRVKLQCETLAQALRAPIHRLAAKEMEKAA